MSNSVSRTTLINGTAIDAGYESSRDSELFYNVQNKKYFLLEEPALKQDHYSAKAVRIGDIIKNGQAPMHELEWEILTPADHNILINNNTIIEETEWGSCIVKELLEKNQMEAEFINGNGYYVPIESVQKHVNGTNSFRCVKLDDSLYGNNGDEIRIYELSWKPVKEQDIKSYLDLPEVSAEWKGESRKYINTNEISKDYACDWDHPFNVKENVGKISCENKLLQAACR